MTPGPSSPCVSDDGRRARLQQMVTADPQRLRRRSLSLGVPFSDADDVAQDALLRAWRSIEQLESPEPGQMCAWLDVIARNAASDLARLAIRRPVDELDEDIPDASDVADETVTRRLLHGALHAIHALPASLRDPLLLSAVDGLSAVEIAQRLGLAPAAVRQRIARARKALSACRESGMSEHA